MSLILEALRKSEAERRRAQAPDLFAPAQVAMAPARRLPPAWLLLAGAVLLVMAIVAARALWPTPAASDASEGDAPRDTSRPASPAMPARPAPAQPMSVAAADSASASASPSASAPSPPQRSAPRLLPVPVDSAASIEAEDAGSPAPADAGIARSAPAATARAGERLDAIQPVPVAPAPPVPALPAPAATEAAAPPMRLSELTGDARRQLPPLRLTMHMWNEAADRRFVILDGRRLAEGDRIGAAQIAEIRRDGVLLDWNGQRLELPLH